MAAVAFSHIKLLRHVTRDQCDPDESPEWDSAAAGVLDSLPEAAGVAGAVGAGFWFRSMTVDEKVRFFARTASEREVSIKTNAVTTVNLLKKFAGPRLPNTVWLDPPNAAPISAPLPD
jgi:hypothetical protein